jgi:hypothetical protein
MFSLDCFHCRDTCPDWRTLHRDRYGKRVVLKGVCGEDLGHSLLGCRAGFLRRPMMIAPSGCSGKLYLLMSQPKKKKESLRICSKI